VLDSTGEGKNDANQIPFGIVVMPDDQNLMLQKSMRVMNNIRKIIAYRLAEVLLSPPSTRARLFG
jgi:hypothetical protein